MYPWPVWCVPLASWCCLFTNVLLRLSQNSCIYTEIKLHTGGLHLLIRWHLHLWLKRDKMWKSSKGSILLQGIEDALPKRRVPQSSHSHATVCFDTVSPPQREQGYHSVQNSITGSGPLFVCDLYAHCGLHLSLERTSSPPRRGYHCSDDFSDIRDSSSSDDSDDTGPAWKHSLRLHQIESLTRDIEFCKSTTRIVYVLWRHSHQEPETTIWHFVMLCWMNSLCPLILPLPPSLP